jgi:hypothetical protein
MSGRLLLVVSTLAGCGHALTGEAVESAYLEARLPQGGCRAGGMAAAQAAAAAGATAKAAALWDQVALGCPAMRDQAGAAVLAASRLGPGAAGRVVNVNYRTQLPPSVRLYWVSAALGARLLPVADAGSRQPLNVEVHAIRFSGGRPGPLLASSRTFDVVIDEGAALTVKIGEEQTGALTLELQVDRPPPSRPAPAPTAQAARKGPLPTLEKARPLRIEPPRAPLEFGAMLRGVRPALRLCLDREGDLDTVRFLEQAHPRLAASMLDMLRDARHSPYRVGDTAVPSCETMARAPASLAIVRGWPVSTSSRRSSDPTVAASR